MESQMNENSSCVDVQTEQPSHLNCEWDEKVFETPKDTNEFEALAKLRECQKAVHDLFDEEFRKSRDLNMENNRLTRMCKLLKEELKDVTEKLSCTEQTLQQTVLELNKETNKNTRIIKMWNVHRKQIACFNEQLDITNEMFQDVLESNEKICKEKNSTEERNELETKYASLVEKHSTFCVGENVVDVKSQLNEKACLKHVNLKQEVKCVNGKLIDSKCKLCIVSCPQKLNVRLTVAELVEECRGTGCLNLTFITKND